MLEFGEGGGDGGIAGDHLFGGAFAGEEGGEGGGGVGVCGGGGESAVGEGVSLLLLLWSEWGTEGFW